MLVFLYSAGHSTDIVSPPTLQLPYQANWQDLKDLFRPAGAIIRADIQMAPDGRPKGSGTVVYETSEDAQNAIGAFQCLLRSSPSVTL